MNSLAELLGSTTLVAADASVCPWCGLPAKHLPAGVSGKGHPYRAFSVCDTCRRDDRKLSWVSVAQWEFLHDMRFELSVPEAKVWR